MTTYFLNNVNTFLGMQLFDELRNDHEEDQPQNRFYVTTLNDGKAPDSANIIKTLNRVPQNVLKKRLLECDVIIYDLNNQDLEEAELAIRLIKDEELTSSKIIIAISSMMVWANTPPKMVYEWSGLNPDVSHKPEKVLKPYTEADYNMRKALPKYEGIKFLENMLLGVTNANITTHIICPGLVYGYGEELLNFHFRSAWLDDPKQLPYIGEGNNIIPTIHIADLATLISKVTQGHSDQPYIFGIDRTPAMTQLQMIEAIAKGIGTVGVDSITEETAALEDWAESFSLNLWLTPGQLVQPKEEENADDNWHCIDGFLVNLQNLREEFVQYRGLQKMSIYITGPPVAGKSHYGRKLAEHYNLPHLQIGAMIEAMYAAGNELTTKVTKRLEEIFEQMFEEADRTKKKGTEVDKSKIIPKIPDELLCEILRWRLTWNDVRNRGFILDGWPKKAEDAKLFFLQPQEEGDPIFDRTYYPEHVIWIKATIEQLKARIKELPSELTEGTHYTEDQTIRRFNLYKEQNLNDKNPNPPVHEWYRQQESELLDTEANVPEKDQLERMLNYINRNGLAGNYLNVEEEEAQEVDQQWYIPSATPDSELLKANENESEADKEAKKQAKQERKEKQRNDEIILAEKERLEISSQSLRYYLYDNVIPALAAALDQCCETRPENPTLFLAEFLEKYNQLTQQFKMGADLSMLKSNHEQVKKRGTVIPCEQANMLGVRWKQIGIPFFMTPSEFQKSVIQKDDIHINYSKFYDTNTEIEVLEFITGLLLMSSGNLELKLQYLFNFFIFSDEEEMTPEEFYICIDKSLRALCNIGEVQLPYIEKEHLEDFKDLVCNDENISFNRFREIIMAECTKFARTFQETSEFMRLLSTVIIDNPFPVLSFLQPGSLFLGKYEIIDKPQLIEDISSIYKRKYKHAMLNVKPMLGEGKLSFELIYMTNLKGDRSFRQNFFREIVLKNKFSHEQVTEFGELPGGILYKSIMEVERSQKTLKEYLDEQARKSSENHGNKVWKQMCLTETDTIELGLLLLDQLEILRNIKVQHSNINPSSVYLQDGNYNMPRFLDLELAIWEPIELMEVDCVYFSQIPEDKYDTTFRNENFLAPEHRDLAAQFRNTGQIPSQPLDMQCDLYSIAAIMFLAMTNVPPTSFSEDTVEQHGQGEGNIFDEFEAPKVFDNIIMSTGMAKMLIKLLARDPKLRPHGVREMRKELQDLKNQFEKIPRMLLLGLEHNENRKSPQIFEDDYVLDLSEVELNDFCLQYIYKFLPASRIPNIQVFGKKPLPIKALKNNTITNLNLEGSELYAEDLKALSAFLSMNRSLKKLDLSKNPIMQRHGINNVKNKGEVDYCAMGFKYFLEALDNNTDLLKLNLSNVMLDQELITELCKPMAKNVNLNKLNLSSCGLGPDGCQKVCKTIETFKNLQYVNLSNNNAQSEGAMHIADLLNVNHHILEIDLFNNQIGKEGGEAIGQALTNNFIIQKLSIGDNKIKQTEMDVILESVMFNTQYTKLKNTNERFGDFGYNLMAESIKRWTSQSKFVQDKLEARLRQCEDEIDQKLAEILLDTDGTLDLQPSPMKYAYNADEAFGQSHNTKQ